MCKTCKRIQKRRQGGYRQRQWGYCLRGHRLTTENTYTSPSGDRECRVCRAERLRRYYDNLTPEQRANRLEYKRIYEEGKRRERGERRLAPRQTKVPQGRRESLKLPAGPFAAWLRHVQPSIPLAEWAVQLGCDETFIRRHLRGEYAQIHIDTADQILMAGGSHLAEIYPYEETD